MKYEEVIAYLHYYAKYFQSIEFEHWELVNAGWLIVRKITNPKYASASIRWAMMNYMRQQRNQRNRVNSKSKKCSLEIELSSDDIIAVKIDNKQQTDNENNEFLYDLLSKSRLKPEEKTLLIQYYFERLPAIKIAEIEGVTRVRIYQRLRKIIDKIRRVAKVA